MLITIAVVLIILWILGLITSTTFGGVIYVLLGIGVLLLIVRAFQGRRV